MYRFRILLFTLLFFHVQGAMAQSADSCAKSINVYLNCNFCYESFLKTEITWVNFVQDQFVADVNLLVATIGTGSGGTDYTLYFQGLKKCNGMNDTLHFVTNAINTDAEIRSMLAQRVKLGLVRYAARLDVCNDLVIGSTNQQDIDDLGIGSNPADDPYNAWVFRISTNTNLSAQKIFQTMDLNANVNASQVKEKFKLQMRMSANYSEQRFMVDGEEFRYVLRNQNAAASYVHSLGDHWSAGAFTNIQLSDFSNYDYFQNTNVSVEYNVFPYSKAQSKLITIGYEIGTAYYDFQDSTIFNKIKTIVPNTGLTVGSSFTQPWGTLSGGLFGSAFLNDFSKYRYGTWLSLDIRVFKGFSISSYYSFRVLRDQINIRKEGASDAEILLQQQELQTNYNLYTYLGLSYRFGSIYNNVVNPRFDFGN
jgi:hypothetical protein